MREWLFKTHFRRPVAEKDRLRLPKQWCDKKNSKTFNTENVMERRNNTIPKHLTARVDIKRTALSKFRTGIRKCDWVTLKSYAHHFQWKI